MFWKKFKKKSIEEKKLEKMMREDLIRPQFATKREEEKYEKLKREAIGDEAYEWEKKIEEQAKRNLMGAELEKSGKIDEAIKLYKLNVEENSDTSYSYRRLAIIYRKRGQIEEEIRVLESAISVFRNDGSKLEEFKQRLEKARTLKSKKGES